MMGFMIAQKLTKEDELLSAARLGDLAKVSELIEGRGFFSILPVDKDTSDSQRNTPLMLAAVNNKKTVVEYLLKQGTNRYLKNCAGETAASLATKNNHPDVAGLIQNYGKPQTLVKPLSSMPRNSTVVAVAEEGKEKQVTEQTVQVASNPNTHFNSDLRKRNSPAQSTQSAPSQGFSH